MTTTGQTTTGQTTTAHPRLARYLDGYQRVIGADIPAGAAELLPALDRMVLHDDPFPFATVDDFLPEDLYHSVLANWPSQSGFDPVARFVEGQPKAYLGNRKERIIENFAGSDAPMATKTWNRTRLALRHPEFVWALFERFAGPWRSTWGWTGSRTGTSPTSSSTPTRTPAPPRRSAHTWTPHRSS
ncbi:hypothetical protein O1L60_45890 [Streptomyces diastatochromogenes]|nr:hypothetical protein [Streptomyces diastatochromogenes]